MKKLKLFGTVVLAASLLFAGCANGSDPTPEVPPVVEDNNNEDNNGENNNGENQNGDDENNNGDDQNGDDENNNGENQTGEETTPSEDAYTITFSDTANSSTYADGVYTITVVNANDSEWGNQIFIKNPNAVAEIAAGDKIHTTITLESDKDIGTMFVKNQFNGGSYSGIDIQKALPANTATVFDIYGTVANDYDESSSIVLALRGNAADTVLKISAISVEKLSDYAITSVILTAASNSVAAGESTTLTAKDQFGFVIADAEFEITSENPVSAISGNVLTAGDSAEEITVVAKKDEITSDPITIIITVEKDYAKYWNTATITGGDVAPADYFSIWTDQNWCGSFVALSNMSATEDSVSLTQTVTGACWFGTQIWYGLSTVSNMSFKVTSTVSGDITVNAGSGNQVYTLEAGVEKEFSFENATGKLAIQLGNEAAGTQLGDCTFTISDFSVIPVTDAE